MYSNELRYWTECYSIPAEWYYLWFEQATFTKYIDEPITETKHKFCRYDACSTTTKYEIKSRRCRYKTFATTTVPVHKVQDITERLVFIFNFTDGLYYLFMMQIYLEHSNKRWLRTIKQVDRMNQFYILWYQ